MWSIGQNIVIPKTNYFSEKIPDNNWQPCEHHNSSYYQTQHAIQNYCQQYLHDRRIQQDYSKNDYDREKGGTHDMIHGGIPAPKKYKTHIIP